MKTDSFYKRFFIFLFFVLIFFSGCLQLTISFEEGFNSINALWFNTGFPYLQEQWPHKTDLSKPLFSQNIFEEKISIIETQLSEFDENLALFAKTNDSLLLKKFLELNQQYISYLKKENQFFKLYNTAIKKTQTALLDFNSEGAFEGCSADPLKKAIIALNELYSKAELLNDYFNSISKLKSDFFQENHVPEKVIDESSLFEMISFFKSLESVLSKNCIIQKDFIEWQKSYAELLKEEPCEKIKEFESLVLKAKYFVQEQQNILFDIQNLFFSKDIPFDSAELMEHVQELSAAERELEKILYSLTVSCKVD